MTTPDVNPNAGPSQGKSLQLAPPSGSLAQYAAQIQRGSIAGQINSWEGVSYASVWVNGPGSIDFVSDSNSITYQNSLPAGQWVKFEITPYVTNQFGQPFGSLREILAFTTATMVVDDVTIRVDVDVPRVPDGPGVVHVNRFGNGMGIVGDRGNNYVQVDLLYDDAGTIRVSGPGQGTKMSPARASRKLTTTPSRFLISRTIRNSTTMAGPRFPTAIC